jgi:cytochrome c peroxidase
MNAGRTYGLLLVAALCAACTSGEPTALAHSTHDAFEWQLPPGFAVPAVPPENPMSLQKVELGRRLFYDKRLSDNGTYSCASCHERGLGFTDGRATAIGSTGQPHPRSSMSLANVAYAPTLTWANPLMVNIAVAAEAARLTSKRWRY